jgi:hypothetical protein
MAAEISRMPGYTFSIRTEVQRNLMYIEQRGRPTVADFLDLKHEFLAEVVKLRPGFSIVNDQREMEAYDDGAKAVAKELVQIANEHGLSRVIRIVPADVLSTIMLSTTLEEAKSRYTSIRVGSPEEAEAALEALTSADPDIDVW